MSNASTKKQQVREVSIEKRKANGNWVKIDQSIECPCNVECKQTSTTLQSKEEKTILWDHQKDCAPAAEGVYRVLVYSSKESKFLQSNALVFYISSSTSQ